MVFQKPSQRQASDRKGTALTELMVCLPTLVFIFLAAVQAADTIFLKQTLHIAGYETIRVAIKRKSTTQQAVASGEQLLASRGIDSFNITFDPPDVGQAERGELLTVSVTAPAGVNTVLPVWFFGQQDMTVETKMVKE